MQYSNNYPSEHVYYRAHLCRMRSVGAFKPIKSAISLAQTSCNTPWRVNIAIISVGSSVQVSVNERNVLHYNTNYS